MSRANNVASCGRGWRRDCPCDTGVVNGLNTRALIRVGTCPVIGSIVTISVEVFHLAVAEFKKEDIKSLGTIGCVLNKFMRYDSAGGVLAKNDAQTREQILIDVVYGDNRRVQCGHRRRRDVIYTGSISREKGMGEDFGHLS